MCDYHRLGTDISPKDYSLEETKNFHKALDKTDYAKYLRSFKWTESRYSEYIEGIEFNIQTSAFSKSNILNIERTCAVFAKNELPAVFALRKDFPRELLHVNLLPKDLPVSLCLYREPYSELRIRLTWEMFIEAIHRWYKRASDGTSHLPGQALEPLILNGEPLLVSNKFFDADNIHIVSEYNGFMICHPFDWSKDLPQNAIILIPINTEPMVSRCIYYAPQTFKELLEMTAGFGVDLRKKLSEFTSRVEELLNDNIQAGPARDNNRKGFITTEFRKFSNNVNNFAGGLPDKVNEYLRKAYRQITNAAATNRNEAKLSLLSWKPMIWLRLPKKRTATDQVEWVEDVGFLISASLGEICEKIGIYTKQNGCMVHEGVLLSTETNELQITDDIADVAVVKPVSALDVSMAQKLSGIKQEAKKYLVVGTGALGSQIVTNLTRLGIGKWDLLDNDMLLPHNLGRHALFAEHTPFAKAQILSGQLNSLMDDPCFSKPILCNFLEYKESIADYDLIFDFSASTAVARDMAVCSERPAIISSFMTKTGKYSIYLYEGNDKSVRVDDIEYQMACACVNNTELNPVLEVHDEPEIRYSGACSDITTVLPQDRVAAHSAIISSYIKQLADKSEPIIAIWEFTEDCVIKRQFIHPSKTISCQVKGWDIRTSEAVIQKMMDYRSAKLPVETGGILIGGFDLYNKIIYVVDVIYSPKDSVEEPYSYIRGFEGLQAKTEKINDISGRRLDYVGEWHTHKNGVSPSRLDKLALNEQVIEMSTAGLPGLMIIIGDKGEYNVLLKQE